jgi:hypothetical protein
LPIRRQEPDPFGREWNHDVDDVVVVRPDNPGPFRGAVGQQVIELVIGDHLLRGEVTGAGFTLLATTATPTLLRI